MPSCCWCCAASSPQASPSRRSPATCVSLHDISPNAINAILAAEDVHFYEHPGFDPAATLWSAWIDLSRQGTTTGASTITQQLIRNVVLDPSEARQTTFRRKLREIVLAYQVDQHYSKDQILEMYLNRVYFGNQSYGIEAAAKGYFGKSARDLDLAHASLIAGLVQSPSQYDPTRTDVPRTDDGIPVQTKDRQSYVLEQMASHGMITEDQARGAYDEKLTIQPLHVDMQAPHWVMYVRGLLEQQFGDRTLYQAGLKAYTTLDLRENDAMQQVLQANRDVIQFHRQTTARTALGNSINIPAVKALEFVTVPTAVNLAQRMGITTWGPDSGKRHWA